MQVSWKKTALLGLLLLVGLYFWIPPLFRLVAGNGGPQPAAQAKAPAAASPVPVKAEASFGRGTTTQGESRSGELTWRNAAKIMESDPLVKSVELSAIQAEPFRIDPDQFPPPVLFAESSDSGATPSGRNSPGDSNRPDKLVLTSTIVGVQRRAALINRRLYFEGSKITVAGETYHLAAVHPRRVILTQGGRSFELKIARQPVPGEIQFRGAENPAQR